MGRPPLATINDRIGRSSGLETQDPNSRFSLSLSHSDDPTMTAKRDAAEPFTMWTVYKYHFDHPHYPPHQKRMRTHCRQRVINLPYISPVFIVATTMFLIAAASIVPCSAQQAGGGPVAPQDLLVQAVRNNDPVTIEKAILELGADMNLQGGGAQTPLVSAVLGGHLEAVEKLLALGADVTVPEKDGYTVMHAAGFQGRSEILKILAAHNDGAIDLSEQHSDGYYPIHRACWGREHRHAETVQTFLDLGVSPELRAGDDKTCWGMTSNPETKALLLAAKNQQKSENEL